MRSDRESRSDDRDGLRAAFWAAVSCLAEGELTFPAPFDLSASAALLANDDVGLMAEKVFALAAARDCAYEVVISCTASGLSRDVVITRTASTGTLIALLEGLLEELYVKHGIE